MKNYLTYLLVLVFFSSVFANSGIFKEYNAQPESNRVILSWVTLKEANIQYFIIKRSNDNQNSFIELDRISAQGPGSQYSYIDNDVLFKSSGMVYYVIEAVSPTGLTIESTNSMFVHPSISGLHKTWGAIKNIFR